MSNKAKKASRESPVFFRFFLVSVSKAALYYVLLNEEIEAMNG